MTEERRTLLKRRLQTAARDQPEILVLRELLLALGGEEMVAPPKFDGDIPLLIKAGFLMTASVVEELMERSSCHQNVAALWNNRRKDLTGIGTGYALTCHDGLWRQHSWALTNESLIETTAPRLKYFGVLLEGSNADRFALDNG